MPEVLGASEQQEMFALCPAYHGHAYAIGNFPSHTRQAGTRYQEWHLHLRGLDDHFAGQPPRRVKDFVMAIHTVQPHHAGDGIYCVMTADRSEEHTSELQSLMRISYAVFCLKKKKKLNHPR